jgi:hypothetical protein
MHRSAFLGRARFSIAAFREAIARASITSSRTGRHHSHAIPAQQLDCREIRHWNFAEILALETLAASLNRDLQNL